MPAPSNSSFIVSAQNAGRTAVFGTSKVPVAPQSMFIAARCCRTRSSRQTWITSRALPTASTLPARATRMLATLCGTGAMRSRNFSSDCAARN